MFKQVSSVHLSCALLFYLYFFILLSASVVSTWLQHAMAVQLLAVSRQPSQIWELRKDANVVFLGKFSTALLCWLDVSTYTHYWYIYNSYEIESKLHHQFILLQVRGISSMALLSLIERGTVQDQFDFIKLWLNHDWVKWKMFNGC